MTFTTQAELLAWCEADRDTLLSTLAARPGSLPVDRPAQALDGVIEDVLYRTLVRRPLPGRQLAWCDYERHRIVINSRLKDISLPNTNFDGLMHSTKAHELAHVRLPHHEPELRARRRSKTTIPAPCMADFDEAETRREFEADFYAGIFLVPTRDLWQAPEAATLADFIADHATVASDDLWLVVRTMADRFHVTGSLMATRLSHVGLVVKSGRELFLPRPTNTL